MATRTLSEAEFNRVKDAVYASLPPNLSEADFNRLAPSVFEGALAEAEQLPAVPEGSAAARLASNAWQYLNPVAMVTGLYEAVKSPEAVAHTLENIVQQQGAQFGKAAEAGRQGRYSEMVAHGVAGAVPLVGPAAAAAGEQIGQGDIAGGLGASAGLVGSILAPGAVKAAASTPVVRAVTAPVAEALEGQAVRLARAGVKAPLALLKQQAGASTAGVNVGATRLAKFLIDNRITSPGQATRIIKNTEAEIQRILAAKGATPTDAPARAQLYLDILEQQAAKAVKPDHAATIRAVAAEMMNESVLGEPVTTTVMRPPSLGSRMAGQTAPVPTPVTTRALRASVPADEALAIARTTSRFETRRSWGEQKGTAMEATKAQERAVRDAFKQALPETRTPLEQQGQAILAEKVLDRQAWRELNRDVISLPGLVGLSANAVVGFAAHWLRNNQLRAGIWADQLAKAIAAQNAPAAAGILARLRVRLPALGPLLAEFAAPPAAVSPTATGVQAAPPGE